MTRVLKICLAAMALSAASPAFAQPGSSTGIEGRWKTEAGSAAEIAPCSEGYCITLKSGKFNGRMIGRMKAEKARFVGTITDPTDDKTYAGSAEVDGDKLKLQGCVFKLFCRSQTWTRLP